MTKPNHIAEDPALNLPLPLDDISKITPDVADILDKDVIDLCSPQVSPIKTTSTMKSKSTLIGTHTKTKAQVKIRTIKTRLGKIMHKLDNIEPLAQPEKPLNIDLGVDLYQMEDL